MTHSHNSSERKIVAMTPDIGLGNPTELRALCKELELSGFTVIEKYPKGFWVKLGGKFHIRMTSSTAKTMAYAENSTQTRKSLKTKPLIWELRKVISTALKTNPNAQFFITPQNMIGELATEVTYGGKKFSVIMILPDVMGKLSPYSQPTQAQKEIDYLVWERNYYKLMADKNEFDFKSVRLIHPLDPILGYGQLSKGQLKNSGYKEVFNEKNLCVIKLSGSGGDPRLINAAIKSLWDKDKVQSIVFPGQLSTQRKLLKSVRRGYTIKTSLDEKEFYSVSRNMQPNSQMMLTYPSEQVKHVMVLSKEQIQLKVVWLPPRGEHEVTNLIAYIGMASAQNLMTSICIPNKYHQALHRNLQHAGFSPKINYQFIDPSELSKVHFTLVPSWDVNEALYETETPRVTVAQAVINILENTS
jgi:hypothetical protein